MNYLRVSLVSLDQYKIMKRYPVFYLLKDIKYDHWGVNMKGFTHTRKYKTQEQPRDTQLKDLRKRKKYYSKMRKK